MDGALGAYVRGQIEKTSLVVMDAILGARLSAGDDRHRPGRYPAFRSQLSEAGYYKEWRGRMGDEAWALLERHAGPLA